MSLQVPLTLDQQQRELSNVAGAESPTLEEGPLTDFRDRCLTGVKKVYEGFQGIQYIFTRPYVFGIFWCSSAHLALRTVLDYQGTLTITRKFANHDEQTSFLGLMAMLANIGTLLLALLGTRKIVECG